MLIDDWRLDLGALHLKNNCFCVQRIECSMSISLHILIKTRFNLLYVVQYNKKAIKKILIILRQLGRRKIM